MAEAAGGGRAAVHASQELLFPKTYSHIGPYVACAGRVKKRVEGSRAGVIVFRLLTAEVVPHFHRIETSRN
jgi:hypothetical protein